MDLRELAWAAGLFEGEGCFTIHNKTSPKATISMVDEEILVRFQEAVKVGKVRGPYGPYAANRQAHYQWTCYTFEEVQHVACLLWFGLSDRRKARVREILEGHR